MIALRSVKVLLKCCRIPCSQLSVCEVPIGVRYGHLRHPAAKLTLGRPSQSTETSHMVGPWQGLFSLRLQFDKCCYIAAAQMDSLIEKRGKPFHSPTPPKRQTDFGLPSAFVLNERVCLLRRTRVDYTVQWRTPLKSGCFGIHNSDCSSRFRVIREWSESLFRKIPALSESESISPTI